MVCFISKSVLLNASALCKTAKPVEVSEVDLEVDLTQKSTEVTSNFLIAFTCFLGLCFHSVLLL